MSLSLSVVVPYENKNTEHNDTPQNGFICDTHHNDLSIIKFSMTTLSITLSIMTLVITIKN
jgi:hypothetical protein